MAPQTCAIPNGWSQLRTNPSDKSFDHSWDKWCQWLENGNEFGTNLAGTANMLSQSLLRIGMGHLGRHEADQVSCRASGSGDLEMQAIVAYIKFLSTGVARGQLAGTGDRSDA
jgi:hypothetical protein